MVGQTTGTVHSSKKSFTLRPLRVAMSVVYALLILIRFEPSFLFSNHVDLLQTKYLTPITLNRIEFNNLIQNNTELTELVKKVLMEYFNKKIGYELAIKGYIYYLVL